MSRAVAADFWKRFHFLGNGCFVVSGCCCGGVGVIGLDGDGDVVVWNCFGKWSVWREHLMVLELEGNLFFKEIEVVGDDVGGDGSVVLIHVFDVAADDDDDVAMVVDF